jgi:hypothetical protein
MSRTTHPRGGSNKDLFFKDRIKSKKNINKRIKQIKKKEKGLTGLGLKEVLVLKLGVAHVSGSISFLFFLHESDNPPLNFLKTQ